MTLLDWHKSTRSFLSKNGACFFEEAVCIEHLYPYWLVIFRKMYDKVTLLFRILVGCFGQSDDENVVIMIVL